MSYSSQDKSIDEVIAQRAGRAPSSEATIRWARQFSQARAQWPGNRAIKPLSVLIGVTAIVVTVVLIATLRQPRPGPSAGFSAVASSVSKAIADTAIPSAAQSVTTDLLPPTVKTVSSTSSSERRAQLQDTNWRLTTSIDVKGNVIKTAGDPRLQKVTLTFRDNGAAYFDDSCNSGGGPITITETTLVFGAVGTSDVSCSDNKAVTTLEMQFTSFSNSTISWEIVDGRLTLKGRQFGILQFERLL